MSNKFTETEAMNTVLSSRGVTNTGLYLEVVRGSLGLKRLSSLDYLVNHLKRKVIWVREARKRK